MNLKRSFDIAAALLLAVPAAPIVLGLAFASAAVHNQSAFYSQQRVGKDGKIFTIYKVRSMRDEFNEQGLALPDAQRTNSFGRFIRKWRVDELPQVFNVLRGDMSMVGPRPFMLSLDPNILYDDVRTRMRPGLFGLAQNEGHTKISYEERLKYDRQYVLDQERNGAVSNLLTDIKIILEAPFKAIKHGLV